jgi:hypothetical protein
MISNLSVIRKRNGKIVPFDQTKIVQAVSKAFKNMTGDPHLEHSRGYPRVNHAKVTRSL